MNIALGFLSRSVFSRLIVQVNLHTIIVGRHRGRPLQCNTTSGETHVKLLNRSRVRTNHGGCFQLHRFSTLHHHRSERRIKSVDALIPPIAACSFA